MAEGARVPSIALHLELVEDFVLRAATPQIANSSQLHQESRNKGGRADDDGRPKE